MVKTCARCGANNNDPLAVFCNKCGSRLPELQKEICSNCGAGIRKDSAFCTKCGARILSIPSVQKAPPRVKDGKICPECGFDENEQDRYYCRKCGSYIRNIQQGDESAGKKFSTGIIRIIPDSVNISSEPKKFPADTDQSPRRKKAPVLPVKGIGRKKWRLPILPAVDFGSLRRVVIIGLGLLLLLLIGIIVISFVPAIMSGENSSGNNTSALTAVPFVGALLNGPNSSANTTSGLTAIPSAEPTTRETPFSNTANPVVVDSPVVIK